MPRSLHASALLTGTFALTVLGAAWLFELAGYLPCQLCLWQRIPYYSGGPLLVLAGVLGLSGLIGTSAVRVAVVICGVIFTAGAVLAAYHSGVEWSFWPGPASCGAAGNLLSTDASDLLNSLTATVPPSCAEAQVRFLGLSFAGWNVIASVMIATACFVSIRLFEEEE